MHRRNNAPRARRPNQNRGMFGSNTEQGFSNMSDRTGALMSRPSPFGNDGPFQADRTFGGDRAFGNDRPFANDRPAPFASEGSLHLQELDLELALLKRKREIIEQQQQLLNNNDAFGRQQTNYSADGPPSLMQNFTKFYNDPPVSGHKRRGEDPWQAGSQPKRFGGPSDRRSPNRGQNRSFNRPKPAPRASDPKPQPRPSRPREPSFRPSTSTPSRAAGARGKNFNPTRVTKPKNSDSGAKPLNSYPAAKRREFVNKAADLVKSEAETEEDFLLTADKPATPRMIGRLELALGAIFKDIHKLHPESAPPLPFLAIRNIKQTIRDRIREVMIGKVVGRCSDTVDAYRAKYAADTDKEVLADAMRKPEPPKRKFINSESPGKYFKTNMGNLLSKKLDEMFEKLKGLFNKEKLKEDIVQTIEEMHAEDAAKLAEAEAEEAKKTAANGDFTADVEINEEKKDKINNENKDETNEGKTEGKEAEVKKADREKKGYRSKYYEKLMEDIIRMQLPDVLPKYKEKILALLDIDEEYKQTKASIIMKSEEIASHLADEVKALEDCDIKIVLKEIREKEVKEAINKNGQRTPLFFVKILGRPYLPKRHLMQEFLDKYKPRAIKRHRNMKNMLFVGFQEKSDFDKILSSSQTVIGNCTLDIKMSDKTKNANKNKDNTVQKDSTVQDDSTVTIEKELDSELDNQIDDLLTSLRQEEENLKAPDDEHAESAEVHENAEKPDAWENGDGTWDMDNNEVTWEAADGEPVDNQPEEAAGDVENVQDAENGEQVENVEDDSTAGNEDDVIEIKDESETQNTDTAGHVTTRRSTRLAK